MQSQTFDDRLARRQWIVAAGLVVLLLALGAGLRLFDLTDEPIDFHPTRQLRGLIIARGMYYEMLPTADPQLRSQALAFWASTGQYEPSSLERVTALGYLAAGRELPWLGRLLNSVFWLLGGLALFDLARRMVSASGGASNAPVAGALVALAYYVALPFGVQASRAFQPDPGMVVWIILVSWSAYRWSETGAWRWALAAGAAAGLAVFTKAVALYPVAGMLIALMLAGCWESRPGRAGGLLRRLGRIIRSPQAWLIAALTLAPTLLFYLGRSGRASEYFSSWTLALSHLLLQPITYLRWLKLVQELVTPFALALALIGVGLARGRARALLLGLWAGYFVYGLFLPYQMTSHSYYHLQLVPLVALSLAPLAGRAAGWLDARPAPWRFLAAGAALLLLTYASWQALIPLYGRDYRNERSYWQEIASYLPADGKIIALTQDYGYRLMYYGWRKVVLWPNRGEIKLSVLRGSGKEFLDFFARRIEGKSYFLITAFGQFADQPELGKILNENFPVTAEGRGYIIFDLLHPLNPG